MTRSYVGPNPGFVRMQYLQHREKSKTLIEATKDLNSSIIYDVNVGTGVAESLSLDAKKRLKFLNIAVWGMLAFLLLVFLAMLCYVLQK